VPPDGTRDPDPEADALPVHGDESVADDGGMHPAREPAVEPQTPEAEAVARAAELAEKLKRVEAEFMNETKRIRRQAVQDKKYAIESVVVDLLPVVDALSAARETLGDDPASDVASDAASDGMREGIDLVEKQLETVLRRYGVAAIEALGQPFDPARHQAMMMIENPDYEPQTVCEVLRVGFELNGRVIRAAEVLVVKPPAGDDESGAR